MTVQSLAAMQWPNGGDPTAPALPAAGAMVELGPPAGFPKDSRPLLMQVEHARSAGRDWCYLTGYLAGSGHTSTFYVRTAGILPTEVR